MAANALGSFSNRHPSHRRLYWRTQHAGAGTRQRFLERARRAYARAGFVETALIDTADGPVALMSFAP
jgi:hypothetical protein